MHKLSVFAVSLLLAPAGAQSFVVPGKLAAATGNYYDFYTFYYSTTPQHPLRIQHVYSTSDITPPAVLVKSLNFRRANAIGNNNPAGTASVAIDLSMGPNDAATAVSTFASNLGASPTTVFNGNVNLPAAPYSGPNPAPFAVNIPFTTPFPYVGAQGAGFVIDMKVATFTPVGTNASWYLDGHQIEGGARLENGGPQSQCLFSNGRYNSGLSYPTHRFPTSNWYVNYNSLLPNAPGVGAIGNVGVGQSWGGIPLPLDLASIGAPNCRWSTNMIFTVGLSANASGSATWPTIPIPNDLSLVTAAFFDHAVFIDLAANAAGLVTTWSSKWTIGSGQNPTGSKIFRTLDTGLPTGTLQRQAVVAELVY